MVASDVPHADTDDLSVDWMVPDLTILDARSLTYVPTFDLRSHSTRMPSIVASDGIENPKPVALSAWVLEYGLAVAYELLEVVAFPGFVHAVDPIDESLTQEDA